MLLIRGGILFIMIEQAGEIWAVGQIFGQTGLQVPVTSRLLETGFRLISICDKSDVWQLK